MSVDRDVPDSALTRVDALLREVPDFPSPGIRFWDLTPVLADPAGLAATVDLLAATVGEVDDVDAVLGIEARGFLLGAPVACALGLGVVPVRKAGKLPAVAASESYALEYGTATLELPAGVLAPGARVWLVDDVLATGGTLAATRSLVARAGAEVVGVSVVLELPALGGRGRLARASAATGDGTGASAATGDGTGASAATGDGTGCEVRALLTR